MDKILIKKIDLKKSFAGDSVFVHGTLKRNHLGQLYVDISTTYADPYYIFKRVPVPACDDCQYYVIHPTQEPCKTCGELHINFKKPEQPETRHCGNCKFEHIDIRQLPCIQCNDDSSSWKPKKPVPAAQVDWDSMKDLNIEKFSDDREHIAVSVGFIKQHNKLVDIVKSLSEQVDELKERK